MGKSKRIFWIFQTLCALILGTGHDIAHAAPPVELKVSACPGNILILVISANAEQYASVTVQTGSGQLLSVPIINSSYDGTSFTDDYQTSANLGFDSNGVVTASFADGSQISAAFATSDCGQPDPRISSARGSIFEDKNGNGLRDFDESVTFSWFKISDGGSWFVCGYTGNDGTFGVPLKSGWYDVIPVAPQGWRVTTPKARVFVGGSGHPALNIQLGLHRDAQASLESCDQYHPVHPIASTTAKIP